MQTQPTPISQIISPNATPGAANRSQPPTSSTAGDFQRTLNRQIEQRQASRNMAQAPVQAPAPRPASPAATPATTQAPAKDTTPMPADTEQAANKEQPSAPATSDSATAEASVPAIPAETVPPPADPAAEMLALVGSIQLAIQPPAAKAAPELPARASVKAEGKGLATGPLLAAGQSSGKAAATAAAQADSGDFADCLGLAQGKTTATPGTSVPNGKAEQGKLVIDAQLAATARAGSAVAEPILKEAPADLSRLAAQLQPGALQQAAAAVAVPADKLTGRVGTPEQQNNGERAASGERRGNGQGGGVSGGEIAIAPAAGGRSRPSLSAVDTFA